MKEMKISIPIGGLLFSAYVLVDVLVNAGHMITYPVVILLATVLMWCCAIGISFFLFANYVTRATLIPIVLMAAARLVFLPYGEGLAATVATVSAACMALLPAVYVLLFYVGELDEAARREKKLPLWLCIASAVLTLAATAVSGTGILDLLIYLIYCAAFVFTTVYFYDPMGPYCLGRPNEDGISTKWDEPVIFALEETEDTEEDALQQPEDEPCDGAGQ